MISGVVITLNEEKNIGDCIDSMLKVCDEVLVLDSHSTDNTKQICLEKGVRFEQTDWKGYSVTKNLANDLATHNYILSIDADERLNDELVSSIKSLTKNNLNGVYSFNRLTNYCGSWVRHCGWYPDVKVRLFPKDKVKWEGDFVHEELTLDGLKQTHIKGDLLHYSYYDKKDHRARADKYSVLTAQKMHHAGKTCGPLKPYLSAIAKFFSVYFVKAGFLDGKAGWNIAMISAQSNVVKYKTLRELNREKS